VGIDIIDPKETAFRNKKRTVVMSTNKLHSWLIYYEPGRCDQMHCHAADQTFHMIAGECTMSFHYRGLVLSARQQGSGTPGDDGHTLRPQG
jgi:hypothetical protein